MVRLAHHGERRRATDVDPILRAAVAQLVAQGHTAHDIVAAALAVGKRPVVDATREQRERLAALIDALAPRVDKHTCFAFLESQKRAQIPVATSLEILERVRDYAPRAFWPFVTTLMQRDYPHYRWGRG